MLLFDATLHAATAEDWKSCSIQLHLHFLNPSNRAGRNHNVGTLLLSVVVLIAIGEGMPNPLTQPVGVQVGFLAPALLLVGILAGWRWELAGGLISLAGWGTLLRRCHLFVLALALPGLLYLTSALARRDNKKQLSA